MTDLDVKDDFPASRRSTYLNTASVTLMSRQTETVMSSWQKDLAENGTLNFDEIAEGAVFGALHRVSSRLFGADPADMAVGSNATELLASLAWAVLPGEGTNVVSAAPTFPSTVYPWARVARLTGAEIRLAGENPHPVGADELIALIDDQTSVVCICHVEFRCGGLFDLARIAQAAHEHGALLVVDATQSAGAIPIDVASMGVDALVTSGYKWLCGPFGVALMYLSKDLQSRLDPGTVGFRSNRDMWELDAGHLELPDGARRFEYSTMAYGSAIGLTRSIELLLEIGIERIHAHNLELADHLAEELAKRGAEVSHPGRDRDRSSIVSAQFPNQDAPGMARYLNEHRIVVSARGENVRFSPHLYNTMEDIGTALDVLDQFKE